jgi:Tfp pilus assembly PilM family ATPase
MAETITGLDLVDRMITAATVRIADGCQPVLLRAGWQECPPEASDQEMARAILSFWRNRGFTGTTVSTCLRSHSVAIRQFQLSGITERDLPAALRVEAEDALQLPAADICMDWQLQPGGASPAGGNANHFEGTLVAAPRADVDRHLALLRKAGLYPVVVDIGPMAVRNLYVRLREPAESGTSVCLVHIGRRLADIAIVYEQDAVFPRTIASSGSEWPEALDYLAANIDDALKFYQFKLRRSPVERVLLCGRVPGKDAQRGLAETLGRKVETWDPCRNLTIAPRVGRLLNGSRADMGSQLASCMGLALRTD